MKFSLWLEIVELQKPQNKITKKTVIKDKGTNAAHKVIEFTWTTKQGNNILVRFEPKGNDEYSLLFYTNNVLYDKASTNTNLRDPEILSGVFYLIKTKADALKAKTLTFTSHKSNNDTKTIFNIDIEKPKQNLINDLKNLQSKINQYDPKPIQLTQSTIDLYKKLNKPIPPMFDLNKEKVNDYINQIYHAIETNNEHEIYDLRQNLFDYKLPLNTDNLKKSLQEFENALKSNTEQGFKRTINRRSKIYARVLDKYFSNDWDINMNNDRFVLTRK